ncbi:MAG: alpha/beta hydrolase [Thiohalocapsa sp.]
MARSASGAKMGAEFMQGRRSVAAAGFLALLCGAISSLAADDDWADGFLDEPDLMALTDAVNEGELEFISAAAADGAHEHLNRIRITSDSLAQGWVMLEQCHENIDVVPAAQIMFKAGRVRKLEIASSSNIGRAWVEGHSVQLEDITQHARLCIRGESQAFQRLGDGHYRLRNGPYMRRFLDGYYPMRVALSIDYPADQIRLVGQSPTSQPGFDVREREHGVEVDATFEGRLVTCFDFCDRQAGDCAEMASDCVP